jgi:hypothetical protein
MNVADFSSDPNLVAINDSLVHLITVINGALSVVAGLQDQVVSWPSFLKEHFF